MARGIKRGDIRLYSFAPPGKTRPVVVLADNAVMQRILSKSGFKLHREIGDPTIEAEYKV